MTGFESKRYSKLKYDELPGVSLPDPPLGIRWGAYSVPRSPDDFFTPSVFDKVLEKIPKME